VKDVKDMGGGVEEGGCIDVCGGVEVSGVNEGDVEESGPDGAKSEERAGGGCLKPPKPKETDRTD